ncbi:MAG: gluconate 2-dehydrogenase subunit 3 family protein [Bacteroidota bacterium]
MNRREILRYAALATGAAVSAPLASAFLSGCKSEAAAAVVPYVPQFFTPEQYAFIVKFADTIIPRTDTPGASDVGVPEMIDRMVNDVYNLENQEEIKTGLTMLMAKMNADNQALGQFAEGDDNQRFDYLKGQDEYYKNPETDWEAQTEDAQLLRDAYFALKQSVVAHYFGSEAVATTQLAYLPVPGEYVPCGDLQELTGGVAWAIK